ncbi:hypothetical protein IW138_001377 [Coemansia sp. RSA 986]|nr:hypothetical protein IW138_001377 [Coemansia sp. RSA 986]
MDIKRLGVNQEELLIQMALGPPAKDLAEWKTKLKYLGVCRHWRSVATKIVYSQAFIELGIGSTGYSDDEYYEDDDLDNDDFDTSLPYKSSSNIGLIVSVRKMHCVRSLSMKTTCVIDSAFLCQEIARLLKLNPTYWITVNELIADFSKAEPLLGAKSSGLNRMSTIYYGLAEIIFKHVPNITMLISRLEYERNACTLFVSYLANQYLSRLYSLSCDTPLLLKSRLPLNTLKIVDMTMVRNERGQSLPSMNGGDLKSISLRKLPYDYSWGSFHYNLATPASIEFVSLKYLLVEYHRKPDEDDKVALDLLKTERPYKYQLLFPALEHLTILRTPLNCDVLFTETNFKHLRMVELNGDIQALNAYTRLKLDTVDHLNVFATPGRDYTEEELYYKSGFSRTDLFSQDQMPISTLSWSCIYPGSLELASTAASEPYPLETRPLLYSRLAARGRFSPYIIVSWDMVDIPFGGDLEPLPRHGSQRSCQPRRV